MVTKKTKTVLLCTCELKDAVSLGSLKANRFLSAADGAEGTLGTVRTSAQSTSSQLRGKLNESLSGQEK